MLKKMKKIWILILFALIVAVIQISIVVKVNKSFIYESEDNNLSELQGNIDFVSNRTDKSLELNNLVKEFEQMYPNIHVNIELIGDVEEILERRAAVGDLPDVTLIPSNIYKKEFNKYFLPIDDLGFNEDNIYDYVSGLGSDGLLYNLSTSFLWQGVIYNKDIFKELGIDVLPKTETEFFNLCKKIKESGRVPVALNYRQSWMMNMWIDSIPYLYNPKMEDILIGESKDVFSEDSEIYKSLNFVRKIYTLGYCEDDIINYEWRQCKEDIVKGKTAMIIWNSDFINQLTDLGMDRNSLGMFPIPETSIIKMNGDYRMGISNNTKYPEEAKEFLKFLFENDRYANAVNIMSSLKGNDETKNVINDLDEFGIPIVFQENVTTKTGQGDSFHDEYIYLRKTIGIDYNFIQNYITCDDPVKIEKDTNDKWRKYRNNY